MSKQCPQCFASVDSSSDECQACGFVWMGARTARQAAKPKAKPKPKPKPKGPAPYEILGWDDQRKAIYYRKLNTGQVASIPPPASKGPLLLLAPAEHWGDPFDWVRCASGVITAADAAGVFDPSLRRGRGIWRDDDRLIWHLGDKLRIDGAAPISLGKAPASDYTYDLRPRLDTSGSEAPLTDRDARRILDIIRRAGWQGRADHAFVAGAAVLGPFGPALARRPIVVITAHFAAGKTEVLALIQDLWGGKTYCLRREAPSPAGIRQTLRNDALPILVDEFEKVGGRSLDGWFELLRVAFDGGTTGRGTAHGQAINYPCLFFPVIAGINTSFANPADRSRAAFARKRHIPADEFQALKADIAGFITPKTGRRLIARTLANFAALQQNIQLTRQVLVRQMVGTSADRLADAQGHLLGAARLLVTTEPLASVEAAAAWVAEVGWQPDAGACIELSPQAEGRQVLDLLLSYRCRWSTIDNPSAEITVRELIDIARGLGTPPVAGHGKPFEGEVDRSVERSWRSSARATLGRLGVKVEDGYLHVANTGAGIETVFSRTKWSGGSHRDRLAELAGAEVLGRTAHFPAGGSHRALRLPLEMLTQEEASEPSRPPSDREAA